MDITNIVKTLIRDGQIEKAIEAFSNYFENRDVNIYNDAILLSSQFQKWKNNNLLGIENEKETVVRIEVAIMTLLDKHELKERKTPISSRRLENIKKQIEYSESLLFEWQEKQRLSLTPTERELSKVEINRLKIIIEEFEKEYNNLLK